MLTSKQLAWLQLIGGLIAGWFAWQEMDYAAMIFAVLFLLVAFHHFTEGKK